MPKPRAPKLVLTFNSKRWFLTKRELPLKLSRDINEVLPGNTIQVWTAWGVAVLNIVSNIRPASLRALAIWEPPFGEPVASISYRRLVRKRV